MKQVPSTTRRYISVVSEWFDVRSRRNQFSWSQTAPSVTVSTTVTAPSTMPVDSNLTVIYPPQMQRRGSSWGYRSTLISWPTFKTRFFGPQFASDPSSRSDSSIRIAWSALTRLTSKELWRRVSLHTDRRSLRSANRGDLVVPRADTAQSWVTRSLCVYNNHPDFSNPGGLTNHEQWWTVQEKIENIQHGRSDTSEDYYYYYYYYQFALW